MPKKPSIRKPSPWSYTPPTPPTYGGFMPPVYNAPGQPPSYTGGQTPELSAPGKFFDNMERNYLWNAALNPPGVAQYQGPTSGAGADPNNPYWQGGGDPNNPDWSDAEKQAWITAHSGYSGPGAPYQIYPYWKHEKPSTTTMTGGQMMTTSGPGRWRGNGWHNNRVANFIENGPSPKELEWLTAAMLPENKKRMNAQARKKLKQLQYWVTQWQNSTQGGGGPNTEGGQPIGGNIPTWVNNMVTWRP